MKLYSLIFFLSLFLMIACSDPNPHADGFNINGSDPEAIAIADKVMEASGGRKAWDNTEVLQWRFFGNRFHTWNKKTGDITIESEKDSFTINMNINSMEGSVNWKGRELTKADSLDKYLDRGKAWWINDSYWIFLPFKLKDSGVTLKYLGEAKTAEGAPADKLELTFTGVGVTPDNKYHVYVDKETNLVSQWDFFGNYADEKPRFSTPWKDYKQYGNIMLSSSRGERGMSDIAVK
jgi:hypothetical protein